MTANPLMPVNPSGVAPMPAPSGGSSARFAPLDPVRVLREYARLLVAAALVGLVAGIGLWWVLARHAPEYSTTAQLFVSGASDPYDTPREAGRATEGRAEVMAQIIQNQVIILKSDEVLSEALKRDRVRQTRWFKAFPDPGNARIDLMEKLSAGQVQRSTFIAVSFRGKFAGDLPIVLREVIDVYLIRNRTDSESQTTGVRRVFVKERDDAIKELNRIQDQLRQFRVEHNLPNLDGRYNDAAIAYEAVSLEHAKMSMGLQQSRDSFAAMQKASQAGQVEVTPDELAMIDLDPAVQSRNEKLRQFREQREVFLDRFGENHRQIKEIDAQMLATEQEKKKEIDRLLRERQAVRLEQGRKAMESIEAQTAALQAKFDQARQRMREMSQLQADYRQIETAEEAANKKRDNAEEVLSKMRISNERPDSVGVRMQLEPSLPELTFPKLASVSVGVMALTTAIALALVFTKELLDQRIKSPRDVLLMPSVDLLGMVPDTQEDPKSRQAIEQIVTLEPAGLIAESFRQVRSALLSKLERGGYRSVMFVGPQPESGVTSVAGNLALSVASSGKRVLLLEANLRRRGVARFFGLEPSAGLAGVLSGEATLEQARRTIAGTTLDVLPAGDKADGGPEMLEGAAFADQLAELESRYDLVVIDAPPALITSEAQLLARRVDAVVVVARAMRDKRGALARMMRQLADQRAALLGVVVNRVRGSAGGYFRKNYREFYGYLQGEQK